MDKLLMIGGPTAVGKTALSIQLAQACDGEVINADAYQIYRGMDIGTAKATVAERAGVVHHLLDIVEPGQPYSVARFKAAAQTAIKAVTARGKLPIVVGGTGFYMNALRLDLPLGGQAPPSDLREQLQQVDSAALWQQLAAQDPAAAAAIPVGNRRRVIRALEVIHETGKRFSQQPVPKPAYDALVIGLTTERSLLYQRINTRVRDMIDAGLVAEVRRVVAQAGPEAQALKAIGYKELLPYLNGEQSLPEAVALIQKNSRHYAKRQLTYFRHQMPTQWYDLVQHPEQLTTIIDQVAAWQQKEYKS
ncbi:tRNA (adenosine(37)-N6)-dimethylallyltransferase MiaA [Lacticaseibacillus jixiensis]|uniref:tRNA (adenosine(37)-N6)-dimethylallyltransferase MiaA n=1 Tax=Lacticaseibacillus jixiensis TaxID=3231926 RepID=UPI0036F41326